jgi:hypothetical protein
LTDDADKEQHNTQSTGSRSAQEFPHVLARLSGEVKQDWPFFALCGFFVTAVLVWRGQIPAVTRALGGDGVKVFFVELFPTRAFFFFVLIFWGLGAGAALLHQCGWPWGFLDGVVRHIELRFLQLTSSILCVYLGVAAYALLYAALLSFAEGMGLLRLVVLGGLLLTSFFLLVSSASRLFPFLPWPWAFIPVVGVIMLFVLLLLTDLPAGWSVPPQAPLPAQGEPHP